MHSPNHQLLNSRNRRQTQLYRDLKMDTLHDLERDSLCDKIQHAAYSKNTVETRKWGQIHGGKLNSFSFVFSLTRLRVHSNHLQSFYVSIMKIGNTWKVTLLLLRILQSQIFTLDLIFFQLHVHAVIPEVISF